MIADASRRDREHVTPFLALPDDLRRVVYTTDTIEAMHLQIRKAIKPRRLGGPTALSLVRWSSGRVHGHLRPSAGHRS